MGTTKRLMGLTAILAVALTIIATSTAVSAGDSASSVQEPAVVNPFQGKPGACIVPGNGNCVEISEFLCMLINGKFHGVGSTCPVPAPDPKSHDVDDGDDGGVCENE